MARLTHENRWLLDPLIIVIDYIIFILLSFSISLRVFIPTVLIAAS